jgi:hypothetical protein
MIWLCVAYLAIGLVCFIVAGLFLAHKIEDKQDLGLLLILPLWPMALLAWICLILEQLSARGYLIWFFWWLRHKLGMED